MLTCSLAAARKIASNGAFLYRLPMGLSWFAKKSQLSLGSVQFDVDGRKSRLTCTVGKNHPMGSDQDDTPTWEISIETHPRTLSTGTVSRDFAPSFSGYLVASLIPNWTNLAESSFAIGDLGEGRKSSLYVEEHGDVTGSTVLFGKRKGAEFDVELAGFTNATQDYPANAIGWSARTRFECRTRLKFQNVLVYVRAPLSDPGHAAVARIHRVLPEARFSIETVRQMTNERGETFGYGVWLRPLS